MDPDEAWIGKVLAVGLIGLVLWGITALLQARSEAARRTRIVLGVAIAIAVAAVWFMMVGPIGFAVTLVVLGAVFWIFSGSKK